MKILGIAAAVLALVVGIILLCLTWLIACPKGSYQYRGSCEYDIPPLTAVPVEPSNEKPPSEKMPSYQRPGVTLATAPSTAEQDTKLDQDKRDAESDGKKAAGIR